MTASCIRPQVRKVSEVTRRRDIEDPEMIRPVERHFQRGRYVGKFAERAKLEMRGKA